MTTLTNRLLIAAGFLTRLPIAANGTRGERFLAAATGVFPVIGAAIGGVGALVLILSTYFGLPPLACALAALAAIVALSGALHEDGLADFCDGIGGGRDREARLRIMRDSRIGTFGALALIFSVGLRAALLAGLAIHGAGSAGAALVAAGAISRAVLPAIMGLVAPARASGLAASAGVPGRNDIALAVALAGAIGWICLGLMTTLLAAFCAGLAAAGIALVGKRTLGGQTGDVLGACQQIADIAVLAVAAAMAIP